MSLILRFRSKDGMFRINTDTSSTFQSVADQLLSKVPNGVDINDVTISDKPNDNDDTATKLGSLVNKSVSELNLKNGDLLYINYGGALPTPSASTQGGSAPINSVKSNSTTTVPTSSTSTSIPINKSTAHGPLNVKQLPVDDELDKLDGMIQRPISSMCRHGSKGMCEYCSPLSPWDESYRKEHSIKHISYHAYLNQQMAKFNKKELASSYIAPLDNPNYAIDLSCSEGHQPMIDHLEYANHSILNDFINVWRVSGVQRFGYLYGRYEKFEKVPMGIKAVVEAIVEPPQSDELDGITLSDWPDEQLVDEIAAKLGIYKVGIVFTDLTDSGQKDGTVLCKRHKDSYFLTNLEILMAAKFQIANPNTTKYSNNGQFSSKFVTCVISGGLQGEIEPRSYQVSTSGEALVKADLITGSTQPSQIYVNESNDVRYVPDISYSKINEYGLEVKTNAKPTFPGEFLLVSLTDSFPIDPHPMFSTTPGYVIENRDFLGDVNHDFQNLSTLDKYLKAHGSDIFDFHLLIYIVKLRILSQDECELLIRYVKDREEQDYLQLIGSGGWMSLLTILEHST
ncbi:unnamed protein product [Candida parapsilosis]